MTDAAAPLAPADPQAVVDALEARARRVETPCGDGAMTWRGWGEGEPLLLFHGGHGAWSHWIRNIEALSAGRAVWAPDLPGCGDSAEAPETTHDAISAVLAQGVRTLVGEGRRAKVIGFSMGAVVAAHFAARHPELISQVILVGAGGLATPLGDIRMQRLKGLEGEARRQGIRENLLGMMLHARPAADDLAVHLQTKNGPRARLQPQDLVVPDKLLGALPRIAAPVDAIWGEFDRPHPPADQETVLRRLRPDLRFRVVPGAGHWAPYENAEAFNRIALELLDAPPAGG